MATKVLNLYAGIGGNRKLWEDVDVTAVEIEPSIAEYYATQFPDDTVVVADAHEYLKENYDAGWDFIWTSPPCQTHTQLHKMHANSTGEKFGDNTAKYPDMKLYQEIIFLRHFVDCDYVVENVKSYYQPILNPQCVDRHYFWSNFQINDYQTEPLRQFKTGTTKRLEREYGFDLSQHEFDKGVRKDQVINNCVHPNLGKHVFNSATKNRQSTLFEN